MTDSDTTVNDANRPPGFDPNNPILPEFWTRPASVIDSALADLRLGPPQFFELPDPPPEFDMFPRQEGGWAVVRHEQILHISKTPEVFSSAKGITVLDVPEPMNEFFNSMIAMDDPRHTRLRNLVSKGFTPRMLGRLEGSVQQQAARIVDGICERGECDFVVDIAAKLPLKIVCDLMGIPESQLDFVFDRTNTILGASDPEYLPEGTDIITAVLTAGQELTVLMNEVAESKEGSDSDDLTTILVNAEVDGKKLSYADIASFFILLVVAGNETTRNAISWGLHLLTENPDQRKIWQDDFDRVAPLAVEEIVRISSPVTYMRRTATQDTEIGGAQISEGDKVLMFYLAANRDEDVFDDPHAFDVTRDPNRHVGFGGPGPHFCMGAHLARREITVMFRELFNRLGDIEASGPPDLLASSFIHGVKHLPATWTPVKKSDTGI